MSTEPIVNKVAESGLITLALEDWLPGEEILSFDLQPFLFMGLALKEKDFRAALDKINWAGYQDRWVALTCSADAIIPAWAYMLVLVHLQPFAREVFRGTVEEVRDELLVRKIRSLDPAAYEGRRVVVKGCGQIPVSERAYVEIAKVLRPVVRSLMFGEPCSTVPLYKKQTVS